MSWGNKILRALLAGASTYLITYYLPSLVMPEEIPGPLSSVVWSFSAICIFFAVAGELARGTVGEHVLDVIRGFTMIFYFSYTTGWGELVIPLPTEVGCMRVIVDMMPFFLAVVLISLVDIARSLLQVVEHVMEREEKPRRPPPWEIWERRLRSRERRRG